MKTTSIVMIIVSLSLFTAFQPAAVYGENISCCCVNPCAFGYYYCCILGIQEFCDDLDICIEIYCYPPDYKCGDDFEGCHYCSF